MKKTKIKESSIVLGDSYKELKKISSSSFNCCITSPPYWGLRDYGIKGQIGAESNINKYVKDIVKIFGEVRRTLKDNGTLWLNIGDTYTSGGRTWRGKDNKNKGRKMSYRPPTPKGLKRKDLIGLPWRIAFALQADGWYLRSDIIWFKPNHQPESVKDRPTRSHEFVFLFTKSEKYYYNWKAISEVAMNGNKKNRPTLWNIKTNGFKGSHFAVFPCDLAKRCISAGTKKNDLVLDPFFGSGTVGIAAEGLQRKYFGIELNPKYISIAKKRIKKSKAVNGTLSA